MDALNKLAEDPKLWDDPQAAQAKMQERTRLENAIKACRQLENQMNEHVELIELGEAEGDADVVAESEAALADLAAEAERMEVETLLSGEADGNDAYLEVHAGAGGTESCDWADMLQRMYLRYAEKKGFKAQVLDMQNGDEAGIKSVSLHIQGTHAYGLLKSERGVHRLVRISPFDSQSRRHTSFSAVDVSPELDDDIDVEIVDSDLRIDTFRAQGAGGQHVNTTDSAVRIVHLPTGTVVQCQAERSQHKNRASAMKMLKARLYEIEQDKKREAVDQLYSAKGEIAWGSQIRSYVMQPYTMVKDHRTDEQIGNVQSVLDGEIDALVQAYLKKACK